MKKLILTESQLRDLIRRGLNEGQRWSGKKADNAASFQSQKDDVYAYFTRLALEVITKKEVLDSLVKAYDEKGPSEGLTDSVMGWSWKKNIDKILSGYGFMKCLKDYSDNFKNDLQSKIMLPVLEWQKYDQIVRALRNAQKTGNQDQASTLQTELTNLLKGQRIFISIEKENEPKLIIMFGQNDAQKVRSIISTGIGNDSTAKNYKSIWGDPDVIDYIEGDEGDVLSGLAATAAVTGLGGALLKQSSAYQSKLAAKGLRQALTTNLTTVKQTRFDQMVKLGSKDSAIEKALIDSINDVVSPVAKPKNIREALKVLNEKLKTTPAVYTDVYNKLTIKNPGYFSNPGTRFTGPDGTLMGFLRVSNPDNKVIPVGFEQKIITGLQSDSATNTLLSNASINLKSTMKLDDIFMELQKSALKPSELNTIYKVVGGLVESRQKKSQQLLMSNSYRNESNKIDENLGGIIANLASKVGGGVSKFFSSLTSKALTKNPKLGAAVTKIDKTLNVPIIRTGVQLLVPTLNVIAKASGIGAVVVWALYGSSFKVPNTNWIEASRLYVIDLNKFSTQPPQAIQVILDDYKLYLQESGKMEKSDNNTQDLSKTNKTSDTEE